MIKKEAKKTTKRVTKKAAPAPAAVPARPLTHEMIAKRAYEIWCGKGKPAGTDVENWIQAEQELFDEVHEARVDA